MTLYGRLADVPVAVEAISLERHERETSSEFTRVTTVIALHGDGETGLGEDVTYDASDHDAPDALVSALEPALVGTWTFDELSGALADLDLFPAAGPERALSRSFRRWGIESAALDLALRQADTDLGAALGRPYRPVRFVTSTRLGDPPRADRLHELLSANPDVEFKLDPTPSWSDELVDELASMGRVRILDSKGRYDPDEVEVAGRLEPADYRRLAEAFPDAIFEDPAEDDRVAAVLAEAGVRVSFDYPIRGVEDVESQAPEPVAINVKPSRFGSIESVLETVAFCQEAGLDLYGGGQFELDVGRGQIQVLASLFYPDGPNDVAPAPYNDPTVPASLPVGPLELAEGPHGFRGPG